MLRGTREPQEVFFSPDALELLTAAYAGFDAHRLLQNRSRSPNVPPTAVDACESSKSALAQARQLPPYCPECPRFLRLCFTDVSPFFLSRAESRFAHRPDVTFSLLDIEKVADGTPPSEQFDVVIAANVIHGMADLRTTLRNVKRLLTPDGLLLLLELTAAEPWTDLVFGLFQGWWKFSDVDLRPTHAVLDRAQWLALLAEIGL